MHKLKLSKLNFFIVKSIQLGWNDDADPSGKNGEIDSPVFAVLEKILMCCK